MKSRKTEIAYNIYQISGVWQKFTCPIFYFVCLNVDFQSIKIKSNIVVLYNFYKSVLIIFFITKTKTNYKTPDNRIFNE